MTHMYETFINTKQYSPELRHCIESTVERLKENYTALNKPGMLLGKVQSGKTNAFIGIIALCFDQGYEICVVLTKGTKALSEQTLKRMNSEFYSFIENDELQVYDIMNMGELTPYQKKQKLIFIVKKEANNLKRLLNMFNGHNDLGKKRILFVDDEADFASIGFSRNADSPDGITMNVLAKRINEIRQGCESNYSFLQVTATPYSLYLQPTGEFELNGEIFEPVKPAFTSLVPIHEQYIGGKQYFEDSQDENSIFANIYIRVPDTEIEVLNKRDKRYLNNILTTDNLIVFRQAILNFLVGGAIRIIQSEAMGKKYKCSFIIHASTAKEKHQWQTELAERFLEKLKDLCHKDVSTIDLLLQESYNEIQLSFTDDTLPSINDVTERVKQHLLDEYVGITKINSANQITALLDGKGQLRLDNPFNIFVGGQILDRGITIDNLIGFFYGRNPNSFQQDAVLQHSRMYGARSIDDMKVTRFYTSARIYASLSKIYFLDSALRESIENNSSEIIFVELDPQGSIRPCASNKILNSETQTIKPHNRLLPIGFQTKTKSQIESTISAIDKIVLRDQDLFLLDVESACKVVDLISSTFEYGAKYDNEGLDWEHLVFLQAIKKYSGKTEDLENKIYCYVKTGRSMSRQKRNHTTFSDAPDDGKTDRKIAKQLATDICCLMLLKQTGLKENGWRDAAFWWPVLVPPANSNPIVFTV